MRGLIWTLLPISAAASLAVTLFRLPTLMAATFRYADLPELPIIAQSLSAGHGPVTLPTQNAVAVIWFDQLVAPLPFHAALQYWVGPAMALAAILLFARCAQLAAGRRAGVVAICSLAVLPPIILWPALFSDAHMTTVLGAAVLLRHLLALHRSGGTTPGAVVIGAVSGLLLVSDPQLLVFGLVPFAVAAASAATRRAISWRLVLVTFAAIAAATAATLLGMWFAGIRVAASVPGFHPLSNIGSGLATSLRWLGWVADAGWFGDAIPVTAVPLLACALVAGGIL